VAVHSAVPLAVGATVKTFVIDNQFLFRWVEGEADVMVKVNEGQPIAEWIYAAVVPFPYVGDGIGLADLQAAWDTGEIFMDEETTAVFTAFWGEPAVSAGPIAAEDLVEQLWQRPANIEIPLAIVPFERLVPELKVLAVAGVSPLNADFETAVYGLTVPIGLVGAAADVELLGLRWPEPLTNRKADLITTIGMTGPAGMRRAVADRMEKYGLTYPAEVTGPVLQALDIAHMSNENAFASDCPFPDPFDSANVCNRDEYLELMTWMGIVINEMTGNHLNYWGVESLLHTFDLYDAVGIQTFGGGRDLAAAQAPLLIEHNGNRLAFVGCNPVGPPSGWAGVGYPGSTRGRTGASGRW
jgi:poly-gamma-glutamate synthesis protein (capsule biosynthesis protein)